MTKTDDRKRHFWLGLLCVYLIWLVGDEAAADLFDNTPPQPARSQQHATWTW